MHDLVFDENQNALMIYRLRNGQGLPWHKLGQGFTSEITLEQAVAICQFNRDVTLEQAYSSTGLVIPDTFAVVDSHDRCFGTVKSRYSVLQDYKLVQSLRPLIEDHDFEIETAGLLKGGAKLWIQLQRGLTADVRPGDAVKAYMLASNAHDGTSHAMIGDVNTRVVCANTLAGATSEGTLAKLRHTGDIEAKWDTMISAYECSFSNRLEVWRAMAGRTVHQTDLDTFLNEFTGKTPDETKRAGGLRDQITEAFESGIGNTASTVWDLFNGVTQVISHSEGRGSDTVGDKAARALESQWFGNGAKQINRAQSILMKGL